MKRGTPILMILFGLGHYEYVRGQTEAWLKCERYTMTNGRKVYKENCNQIKQVECSPGEKRPVTIEFTKILMCGIPSDGSTVNAEETYLKLRGSAIKSYNDNKPMTIPWNSMNDNPGGSCARKTYDVVIDQCMDHFNAYLFTKTKDGNTATAFDTYMKRRCTGLKASVTCTHEGVPCDQITKCVNDWKSYDYEFCIENTYDDHAISVTRFYGPDESPPYSPCNSNGFGCKKTIAYIGDFTPNKIFPFFPNWFDDLSYTGSDRKKCWSKSKTVNTCTNNGMKIPSATVDAYGVVTSVRPNANTAGSSEFQECFSSATIPHNYLDP